MSKAQTQSSHPIQPPISALLSIRSEDFFHRQIRSIVCPGTSTAGRRLRVTFRSCWLQKPCAPFWSSCRCLMWMLYTAKPSSVGR